MCCPENSGEIAFLPVISSSMSLAKPFPSKLVQYMQDTRQIY